MKTLRKAIIKFDGDKPVACILPVNDCGGGCHGCGACGNKPAGIEYELPVDSVNGHKAGDRVSVEIKGPGEIASGLVMFVLPLLLLLASGAIGNYLWDDTGMVLSGLAGLAAGFFAMWILSKTILASSAHIVEKNF